MFFLLFCFFYWEVTVWDTANKENYSVENAFLCVFECESLCTSIGTGMIANVLVFAHKFVWIFFTVCECILGEKFAMSSARIGLRGLYCFFFIEFHL